MKKPGSARGSIPTSRVKGGGRAALHGATVRQHCRLSRRDGAAGQQELPRPAARETGRPESWAGQAGDRLWPARGGRVRLRRAAARERRGSHLTFERRATANWVDFLSMVEAWIDPAVARVYAVLDNLNIHRAPDVLLFSLLHPRWEFVFQPKYAAYLNLIEPWWKVLRSLALKGRRFEAWTEIEEAVARATAYWNDHRHPFVWGRRRDDSDERCASIGVSA